MATEKTTSPPVSWAQAVRDIVIVSINKGQLPLVIFGAVLLVLVWRMPPADVGPLANRILDGLEQLYLVGYVLFVLTVVGWFVHSRHQQKFMGAEINRLSEERSRLQQAALGAGVQSSARR